MHAKKISIPVVAIICLITLFICQQYTAYAVETTSSGQENVQNTLYIEFVYQNTGKTGSGTHHFLMFLIVILGFTMYGFIFAGSIATGRNKARHAVKIPSKILSFLIWFFLCSWLGVMTVGIMPMVLAKQSGNPSGISRKMKIFIIISSFICLCIVFRPLIQRILYMP